MSGPRCDDVSQWAEVSCAKCNTKIMYGYFAEDEPNGPEGKEVMCSQCEKDTAMLKQYD